VSADFIPSDQVRWLFLGPVVPFRVHAVRTPGWNRLTLEGELDLASAPILEAELDRLACHPAGLVIVDLRRLSFMDVAGLRVLLTARQAALERGRRLAFVRGPRAVQRLFSLVGVEQGLDLVKDPADVCPEPPPHERFARGSRGPIATTGP
jgi:anti-anti-sigma factor